MKTRLFVPFPPSANAYWVAVRGRVFPSREALAYKRAVLAGARGVSPFVGPVRVLLAVHRPRATGDLDNCLKVLFDALNLVTWLDDSQVVRIEAERFDGALEPGVEVTVEGERWATAAEVAAHKQAKVDANKKRKKTLALNRAAKRIAATPNYRSNR